MSVRVKRYLKIIVTVLGCLLLMTVGIYFKYAPRHQVSELESITARIPLGISSAQADAHLGTPPDVVSQTRGTLLNSTMLLTADNPLSAQQGDVQLFTLRTWHSGDTHATVAVNQSGKVAGRWSWSDHPPSSKSQFNLNEVAQRIFRFWRYLTG